MMSWAELIWAEHEDDDDDWDDDGDDDDGDDDDSSVEDFESPITITLIYRDEETQMTLPGDAVSGLAITWFFSLRHGLIPLQPRDYRLRGADGGLLGWHQPVHDGATYTAEMLGGIMGGAISL